MTKEEFVKLRKKAESEMNITKENVLEKSLQIPKLQSFYINLFTAEYHNYQNLLSEKDKIYGERFHHYKYKSEYSLDKKSEIEPFIHNDELYYKHCKKCNDQEMICKWLEKTLKKLENISYNIKNFVDYNNFLQGGK